MPEWAYLIVIALIAASGGWLTYLTSKRTSDSARIAALEARVDAAERKAERAERKYRRAVNYATKLRRHIDDELGPPPPDWPEMDNEGDQ